VPGVIRQICLTSQDRSDPGLFGNFVESLRGVEVAMVRDGEAIHSELGHARHEIADAIGAVEQRELGVGMEVYKGHEALKLIEPPARCQNGRVPRMFREIQSSLRALSDGSKRLKTKTLGCVVAILGTVGCGGDGPELPIASSIQRIEATNGQRAFAGARLPVPLAVTVADDAANEVARAEVRWTVLGGTAATPSDSVTVSDGLGRAEVDVTLGDEVGAFTIRAELRVDAEKNVLFEVTAVAAPSLTGLTPSTFSGGDTIIVSGASLSDTLIVDVAGAMARIIDVAADGQEMTVVIPGCLVPGSVDVRVLFPGGSTDPLSGIFEQPASQLSLEVGEYVSLDPATVEDCAILPATGSEAAQYVVVPQATTTVPNMSVEYRLMGDNVVTVAEPSVPREARATLALQFHDFLRGQEERFSRLPKPERPAAAPALDELGGIEVGDQRTFRVCDKVTCETVEDFPEVTAEAKYVGDHAAIFLDVDAPDTLTTAIFNEFGTLFEEDLYAVATRAFGSESDVDENGHLLILMTPVVNGLTPEESCETSIVTGFFFAIDIDPAFQGDPRSNQGEVFYALTPDPLGELGCAHSIDRVRRLVPVTFVHELQHMINYNQHVLVRGGSSEVLWLNEGLSHISEELAALRFASLGRQDRFSDFAIGNLYNAYLYLEEPGATYVLFSEGTGSLAERGGTWLMLRWLLDQFGDETATRRLVETQLTGAANLEGATGISFDRVMAEWMLAVWVSDLVGFDAPARLRFTTWPRLRGTYADLHNQIPDRFQRPFPLVPTTYSGSAFSAVGTLRSGSGEYFVIDQAANREPLALRFERSTGGALPATTGPRLTILRTR
jgi:hypothetical protein